MVDGRWTLVERTESDGKRLIEAHTNIPRRAPLADLSPLERACVELARRGNANKQIAYALGLPLGTVSSTLSAAMRKVGVRSRVGLIALGDAPSFDEVTRILGATATQAEISVAALAVAGMSNAEIAEQRGVAPRTIANQLARVFERVGVGSRAELAALVQACKRRG
jgi:DNA-binding CsgD family transcriptional regulator